MFSGDLVRAMETETEMAYVTASSYVGGFTPGDSLRLDTGDELDVAGRDVLIVDDIIDTGRTLSELADVLRAQGPRSISTVSLVSKTRRNTIFRSSPSPTPDGSSALVADEPVGCLDL